METAHGMVMPRRLQVEFSGAVQRHADSKGGEITSQELWDLFASEYLKLKKPILYARPSPFRTRQGAGDQPDGGPGQENFRLSGKGNGPIDAAVQALGLPITLHSYEERAISQGADAKAVAFVEVSMEGVKGMTFGVGIHENIVTASIKAVMSAVNRVLSMASKELRAACSKNCRKSRQAKACREEELGTGRLSGRPLPSN